MVNDRVCKMGPDDRVEVGRELVPNLVRLTFGEGDGQVVVEMNDLQASLLAVGIQQVLPANIPPRRDPNHA